MVLNDLTSAQSLLETRRSGRPREMIGPGPTQAQLDQILAIAARTPDHGKLSPWRFVIVEQDGREALAELFRTALEAEEPDAPPAKFDKADLAAKAGGALVVLISAPVEGHKIPAWEQQLSCGAAGMNILWAAHALGFVGAWVTGWQAYSPAVNKAMCKPGERIAGFVHIGHPDRPLEDRPREPVETLIRRWPADAN
jgi:nitroreductase